MMLADTTSLNGVGPIRGSFGRSGQFEKVGSIRGG